MAAGPLSHFPSRPLSRQPSTQLFPSERQQEGAFQPLLRASSAVFLNLKFPPPRRIASPELRHRDRITEKHLVVPGGKAPPLRTLVGRWAAGCDPPSPSSLGEGRAFLEWAGKAHSREMRHAAREAQLRPSSSPPGPARAWSQEVGQGPLVPGLAWPCGGKEEAKACMWGAGERKGGKVLEMEKGWRGPRCSP